MAKGETNKQNSISPKKTKLRHTKNWGNNVQLKSSEPEFFRLSIQQFIGHFFYLESFMIKKQQNNTKN